MQNENEIPQQIVPNSGYYLLGREVRIVDNLGQISTFVAPQNVERMDANKMEQYEKRITECENKIHRIYTHLTSFKEE